MKHIVNLAILAALVVLSVPATAATKTVTLSVPGMQCQVCPLTVRKALTRVDGVSKADVSFEKKEATVTFDDTKTNVDALRKATADAGFPSTIKP